MFYEERCQGLGYEFLDAVHAAIEAILILPDASRPYPDWDREPQLRTKAVEGFPYRVIYLIDEQDVVIFAYRTIANSPATG
ncbi:MAG: type II toxin-antitoxin system RelE/ParE family toxin [Protaetiibacter sp.]